MGHKVGYFLRANEGVYEVVRGALPDGMQLVTLAGRDPAEEIERVRDVDFLIGVKVSEEMIRTAGRLRLIQLPGVGYDQVNLNAASQAGIPVALALGGSSDAVAEHTLLLMLAVSRRLVELANSMRAGKWLMWDRRTCSYGLQGKTLGIIGMGRIGREVASRAAAFGMSIQYYDVEPSGLFRLCPLDELLRTSDIVSLHCPLTADTRRLVNRERIALMKKGAILINAARGEIVDEAALCEAIVANHLAGAGLDVFEKEPPDPANPLLRMDQVVVTPHVATGTLDSLRAKAAYYAENIRLVMAGEQPVGLLTQTAAAS
jgi:phosphoglycerate dehydrogenase-like enzyme